MCGAAPSACSPGSARGRASARPSAPRRGRGRSARPAGRRSRRRRRRGAPGAGRPPRAPGHGGPGSADGTSRRTRAAFLPRLAGRVSSVANMDDWVLWLIAAAILAVGEIATGGLFLAPFAAGALVAAIISGAGAGLAVCLAVALVVSVVLLAALRPIARSHRRMPPQIRTGTAALVGRDALVLERTTLDGGVVKLDGEQWSARTYDGDEVFEPGQRVQVVEIRGAIALVTE